jgi:hypothetical protein
MSATAPDHNLPLARLIIVKQFSHIDSIDKMKAFIILRSFLVIHQVFTAREAKFDSLEYSPQESDLLDYGTLKLTKTKARNTFYLNGNFTVKRTVGNEKLVRFEVWARGGGLLVTSTYAFCEFTKIDNSKLWSDLIKSSNMPKDLPCPYPEVHSYMHTFWVKCSATNYN